MNARRDVSVVLPFRDAASTIEHQLAALAAQDFAGSWEIVAVDNGSTDGTADIVRSWRDRLPHLRVVPALDRAGVAHARKVGARAAAGLFVLFCDADDEVDAGWVRAMTAALQTCDHAGGLVDDVALNPPDVRACYPARRRDALQVAIELLPYAPGCNCGVRREVVDALGGWDESYDAGGNDVEFSLRVQLAGFRLCWVPDAVVRYRLRPTRRGVAARAFRDGVAQVRLVRGFRAHGARDRPLAVSLRTWAKMAATAPLAAVHRDRRGRWCWLVAHELGRVVGRLSRWPVASIVRPQ